MSYLISTAQTKLPLALVNEWSVLLEITKWLFDGD